MKKRLLDMRYWGPVVLLLWPFVYLYEYVVPVHGLFLQIGNDFGVSFYNYNFYLLSHLARFRFPMWSPSEAVGFPFFSNFLTQAFYPLNLLQALLYRCLGGYHIYFYQLYTILAVSLFSLGLFCWLQSMRISPRAALMSALVMSVSFKITETLRFPNSIHTAAWYPWILFAINEILKAKTLRRRMGMGAILFCSILCVLTAGYPYFIYYFIFLFAPYLLLLLWPSFRKILLCDEPIVWKPALGTILLSGGAALVICLPYISHGWALMAQCANRGGRNFAFSTAHEFTVMDSLGCLFYPPAAQTEGWYYFSGLGALLIAFYFAAKSTSAFSHKGVKIFFLLWMATISYVTYGRYSYLFMLLWNAMPGFSSLRVWGRLNIILVPIFAWLLALAYDQFESRLTSDGSAERRKKSRGLLAGVATFYAVMLSFQLAAFFRGYEDEYWRRIPSILQYTKSVFILSGAIAFAGLMGMMAFCPKIAPSSSKLLTAIALAFALFCAADMHSLGARIWVTGPRPMGQWDTMNLSEHYQRSFSTPRFSWRPFLSFGPDYNTAIQRDFYYARLSDFLDRTAGEKEARERLFGVKDGKKMYFSRSLNHETVQSFLEDADHYPDTGRLLEYSGNRLLWEIQAPCSGYLSFIDNWDPDWRAEIDGKPAPIERLFGAFKSVALAPGPHRIEFDYRPGLFAKSIKK
ncbi:MAG: hypothetical protein NTX50_02420 [Candidatus Sumerlaeota bacterium]|nr:hypothetical protein [Candidatus Sumerlaeota bacterium]